MTGRLGRVRSRAWIWLFSSSESTTAVARRVHVEADDVLDLLGEGRIVRALEAATRCGWRRWASQMRWTDRREIPTACARVRPVQWVTSPAVRSRLGSTWATVFGGVRRFAGRTGLVAQEAINTFFGVALLPASDDGD